MDKTLCLNLIEFLNYCKTLLSRHVESQRDQFKLVRVKVPLNKKVVRVDGKVLLRIEVGLTVRQRGRPKRRT